MTFVILEGELLKKARSLTDPVPGGQKIGTVDWEKSKHYGDLFTVNNHSDFFTASFSQRTPTATFVILEGELLKKSCSLIGPGPGGQKIGTVD